MQYQEFEQSENDIIELEQGQMKQTKYPLFNPIYNIKGSKNDKFYMKFFECFHDLKQSNQIAKYDHMKKRIQKYFIIHDNFEQGTRWCKRIQPDYYLKTTYPLFNSVLIYGVDFLSNKDIRKLLNINKSTQMIRLNWSNIVINFQDKSTLQSKIKPFLYIQEKHPFFLPKILEEEDDDNQELNQLNQLKKLPRNWYGLKPYVYKEQYMHWFVRYLTNIQKQKVNQIKINFEFNQTYQYAKKIYKRKQKIKQELYNNSLNTSSNQLSSHYQRQRIRRECQSQRIERQRSRQKSQKILSQVLNNNQNDLNLSKLLQLQQNNQIQLNQSMSFVYNAPLKNKQQEYKNQSDRILEMFQNLNLQRNNTLSINNFQHQEQQQINDMQIIRKVYDPKGINDQLLSDKQKIIYELTEYKPFEKFNYTEYVQKIMEAQESNKKKKSIPIIVVQ